MRFSLLHIILLLTCWVSLHAQDTLVTDTIPRIENDTIVDGVAVEVFEAGTNVKISKDSLEGKVKYGARDSMRFDNAKKEIHLFGEAYVEYQSLNLTADYIIVNIDSNLATAKAGRDTADRIVGVPEFRDGPQVFNAMHMKYNFKSKKGIVYEAVTQEGDIFVRGTKTKYISEGDLTYNEDLVYNEDAIFTTCDHPEPHFGIRSKKQKMVPNKLVVVGPSRLEVGGVPTPLVLPFAFFPLAKGQRSGLILPRDYEYSDRWGFGFRDFGYYFPINEYMDLRLLGDIYFNGTWGLTANSGYKKKYKYNGNLRFSFGDRVEEATNDYRKDHERSVKLYWSHTQDPKSNPFHNFSGNINFEINRYDRLNRNDFNSALNNTLGSQVTYRRTFPGKPYSLSMGMSHSQNNNTRIVDISFPEFNFNLRRINPFKSKKKVGKEKWFEKVGFNYSMNAKSRYRTTDTLLFKELDPSKLDYGISQKMGATTSHSILKYINFNVGVNFTEFWHFRRLDRGLDNFNTIVIDTVDVNSDSTIYITESDTTFGMATRDTINKFTPFHQFSLNAGLQTKLFGTLRFKGWLRGLRHVATPSVSFNYSPNYRDPGLEYWRTVNTDTRSEFNNPEEYSIFLSSLIGTPSVSEERMGLSFALKNNFEAKYFSKADSTDKNIKLLDNIDLNTFYNFAADSFHWDPVRVNAYTKLFGGMTNVTLNASFDPYAVSYDESGNRTRLKTYHAKEGKGFLRFDNASANIRTGFTIDRLTRLIGGLIHGTGKDDSAGFNDNAGPAPDKRSGTGVTEESLYDLFKNFSVSHSIRLDADATQTGDTLTIGNHFVELRGSLSLTPKWRINVSRIGYNFLLETLTYPDLGFERDLHCWTLSFNWSPVRGTYSLFLGVKPGSMDFIKVPYRKNNVDAFF